MATFFPWVLYIIAWICTLAAVQNGAPFWPVLLLFVVVFNGGIQGLWSAIGHLGFPKETAKKIGWKNSEFQTEVGFADLAIGFICLASLFYELWAIPMGLVLALFYIGCAYTHIKDRIVHKNKAPCNSGPMLYCTIAVVITLMSAIIVPIYQYYL